MPVEEAEKELIFVGFMGMNDPPRPEAKRAIKMCHDAGGIKVKMITGDHAETALAIAAELGGLASQKEEVISGTEIESLSAEDLATKVNGIKVLPGWPLSTRCASFRH